MAPIRRGAHGPSRRVVEASPHRRPDRRAPNAAPARPTAHRSHPRHPLRRDRRRSGPNRRSAGPRRSTPSAAGPRGRCRRRHPTGRSERRGGRDGPGPWPVAVPDLAAELVTAMTPLHRHSHLCSIPPAGHPLVNADEVWFPAQNCVRGAPARLPEGARGQR